MKRIACLLLMLFTGSVNAVTINFNEGLSAGTQLEGSNFYDYYGVTFESAFLFGPDTTLPDDGWGITNFPNIATTVNFTAPVYQVDFTWAVASFYTDFSATAFDASNNVLGSFFFDSSLSNDTSGVVSLAGLDITRLEFSASSRAFGAIDTLSFYSEASVPEPASLALLGLGLAAIGFSRKIKKV